MEYTITELKGTYPSNYPDSQKYVFRVENYEHELSGFSKFPVKVGDKINGDITIKGNYHNFKFVAKSSHQKFGAPPSESTAKILSELTAIRTELNMIRGILADNGMKKVERNSDGSPLPFGDEDLAF